MKRVHRKVLLVAFMAVPLVIAAACTFPDVSYRLDGSADGDAAGVDGQNGTDAASDARPPELLPDAAQRPDGQGPVSDASCADAAPCDCDGDGYLRLDCPDGSADAKAPPGDCDDLDPLRHPKQDPQPYPWDKSKPGADGDWDCSGKGDRTPKKVACGAKIDLGVTAKCPGGTEGFISDNPPFPCGYSADIYTCPTTSGLLSEINCDPVPSGRQATVNCQ